MSTARMMDRSVMGMPGMGMPAMGTPPMGPPVGMPAAPNYLMVPRCTFKMEKCQGGMKMTCVCEDKAAAGMVQNLCSMLAGGMCSCCCLMNGMVVHCCNFTVGMCMCEPTPDGICFTCTSGDAKCCEMIQACCDCLCAMTAAGCTCCFVMNQTPICCGTCGEPAKTTGKTKR
jgi:hypothetical protein